MVRRVLRWSSLLALVGVGAASALAAAPKPVQPVVVVDGRKLDTGRSLMRDRDRWLFPLVDIIRTMGGEWTWDGETKGLTIAFPRRAIRCDLASGQIWEGGAASPIDGALRIVSGHVVATAEGLRRVLGATVEYRGSADPPQVIITSAWSPGAVTVAEFLRWKQFLRGKSVELAGEFWGWLPGPDDEATAQGPPRWWGDWILGDETGAVYVSGRFPEGLDPYDDLGRSVRVLGLGRISEQGIPYLEASEVRLPAAEDGPREKQ